MSKNMIKSTMLAVTEEKSTRQQRGLVQVWRCRLDMRPSLSCMMVTWVIIKEPALPWRTRVYYGGSGSIDSSATRLASTDSIWPPVPTHDTSTAPPESQYVVQSSFLMALEPVSKSLQTEDVLVWPWVEARNQRDPLPFRCFGGRKE